MKKKKWFYYLYATMKRLNSHNEIKLNKKTTTMKEYLPSVSEKLEIN